MNSETRFHQIVLWFQNHKFFAWVLFAFVLITGASTLTGAIDKLASFSQKYFAASVSPQVHIQVQEILPVPRISFGYHYFSNFETQGFGPPDTLDRGNRSPLVLRENGTPLGPAHSGHNAIEEIGEGRYSHWLDDSRPPREYLYFSTSDNSDPRSNGRRYSVSLADENAMSLVLDNQHIRKVYGDDALRRGYRYRGAGLRISPADSQGQPTVSRLVVLENGMPLGPAHSPIREVLDIGQGRYSHWHDGSAEWLFFSTSDDSDPRINGRTYTITVKQ